MEKLRKKQEEEELHKPRKYMNEKSKKLVKNIKPIYERIDEIKNKKIEDIIKIKSQVDDEKKYKDFKDYIIFENIKKQNKKNVNLPDFNNFNDWYIQNENWKLAKKERINNKKLELDAYYTSKNNECCSFHPQINKDKFYYRRESENIGTRLYNDYFLKKKKMENLIEKYTPSFKPEINKNNGIQNKTNNNNNKVFIFDIEEEENF